MTIPAITAMKKAGPTHQVKVRILRNDGPGATRTSPPTNPVNKKVILVLLIYANDLSF
jgi:hypothetical protein